MLHGIGIHSQAIAIREPKLTKFTGKNLIVNSPTPWRRTNVRMRLLVHVNEIAAAPRTDHRIAPAFPQHSRCEVAQGPTSVLTTEVSRGEMRALARVERARRERATVGLTDWLCAVNGPSFQGSINRAAMSNARDSNFLFAIVDLQDYPVFANAQPERPRPVGLACERFQVESGVARILCKCLQNFSQSVSNWFR